MNEIFTKLLGGEYDTQAAINLLKTEKNTQKISDPDTVKKLIIKLDNEPDRKEVWDNILPFIDVSIFDDSCFNYFWENDISLNTLAHLDLQDKYLKKLLRYHDEAYIFLARRYYSRGEYSVYDFAELLSKCRYESVFYDLLLNEKNINPKGSAIHTVIQNSEVLSGELKAFSRRCYEAKILFCTDDTQMIEAYYKKNDHIYMAAISRNILTPEYILRELPQISGVKLAARIREKSRETLRIKAMLKV